MEKSSKYDSYYDAYQKTAETIMVNKHAKEAFKVRMVVEFLYLEVDWVFGLIIWIKCKSTTTILILYKTTWESASRNWTFAY